MPRTRADEDPEEEDDYGAGEYVPESSEAGELWCPKCGAVMYADAVRCPACEAYVTPGLPPPRGTALVWRIAAAVLLLAIVAALFASCFARP